MSIAYKNGKDIALPSFAYPDRHDGRVFIFEIDEDGRKRKKTIGHMTDSTAGQERMVPNQYFKDIFPNLWNEAYPHDKLPAHSMSAGMYALTLGIGTRTGLYLDIRDTYGPQFANNILDYAMFSILHRSSTVQLYKPSMQKEVLFAD